MTTKIAQIKSIGPSDKVGYNGTFAAKRPTQIAILPIGYYDGLDRRLSNKGTVLLNSLSCPIVGRISMNITTVDLGQNSQAKVGDEILVISSSPDDPNSAAQIANASATIPYDILVHLSPINIRREIVE